MDNGPFKITWQNTSITSVWSLTRMLWINGDATTAEKEKAFDVFDHWKSTRVNCCSFILNDFKDSSQQRQSQTTTASHFLKKACCLPMPKIHSLLLNKAAWFKASFMSAQVKRQTLMLRLEFFFFKSTILWATVMTSLSSQAFLLL